jgi:hypothetical protein
MHCPRYAPAINFNSKEDFYAFVQKWNNTFGRGKVVYLYQLLI